MKISTLGLVRLGRAMRFGNGLGAIICSALLLLSGEVRADKRVALVVGNSAYQNVKRLENPKNDAQLMAQALEGVGFTLVNGGALFDLDKQALDAAVRKFGANIQGADVALFYYAGHGVQVGGSNYLVPINANPIREADVDFEMVDINVVLRQLQDDDHKRLNLLLLDACRNNPFGGRGLGRAADGGLAQMRAPAGTLISYATQPGNIALDGNDGNSPYTKALARTISRSGLDVFQTFNQVGLDVERATSGAQQPWTSSSPIDGNFYFGGAPPATNVITASDEAIWDYLKRNANEDEIRRFIAQFPNSTRRAEANERLSEIQNQKRIESSPLKAPPVAAPTLSPDFWNNIRDHAVAALVPPTPPQRSPCLGGGVAEISASTRPPSPLSHAEECALSPKGSFKECLNCPEMIVVQSGSFLMGSPESERGHNDDETIHQVTIKERFAAGKAPITFTQWDTCVSDGGCNGYRPSNEGWGGVWRPVINVSWQDAQNYVSWLSKKTGQRYRLLSEAEREYITRAGTTTAYWNGPDITKKQANFQSSKTEIVGTYPANPWGFYDVHGNVSDWTEDCAGENWDKAFFHTLPTDGSPAHSKGCDRRIIRGGNYSETKAGIRSAERIGGYELTDRNPRIGFRVARDLTN